MEKVLSFCGLSPDLTGFDYFESCACFYDNVVNPMIRVRTCVNDFKRVFLGKFCVESSGDFSTTVSSCLEHGYCLPPSFQQFLRMCNSLGSGVDYWQFNGLKSIRGVPKNFPDFLKSNWEQLGGEQEEENPYDRKFLEYLCFGTSYSGTCDAETHYYLVCDGEKVDRCGGDVFVEIQCELLSGYKFVEVLEQHVEYYIGLVDPNKEKTPEYVEEVMKEWDNVCQLSSVVRRSVDLG